MPNEVYDATQRNPIEDISRAYSQNLSVDNQRGISGYMERQIVSPIPFLPALDVVFDSLVRKEIQPMASTLVAAGYRRRVAAGLARRLVKRLFESAGA